MVPVSLSTTAGSTAQFKVNVANVGELHGRVTVLAMWRPVGHHFHLRQKLFGAQSSSIRVYLRPYTAYEDEIIGLQSRRWQLHFTVLRGYCCGLLSFSAQVLMASS